MAVSVLFVASTLVAVGIVVDDIYGPVDERVFADAALAASVVARRGDRARRVAGPTGEVRVGAVHRRSPSSPILDLEMWDRGLDGRGWLATGIASGGVDFIYVEPPVIGRLLWIVGSRRPHRRSGLHDHELVPHQTRWSRSAWW